MVQCNLCSECIAFIMFAFALFGLGYVQWYEASCHGSSLPTQSGTGHRKIIRYTNLLTLLSLLSDNFRAFSCLPRLLRNPIAEFGPIGFKVHLKKNLRKMKAYICNKWSCLVWKEHREHFLILYRLTYNQLSPSSDRQEVIISDK